MAVTWTDDQKKIIETRDRNLLVAAAAGSGKTAVLVERIVAMITDPEHPADIDRLLVVTFTNAAAGQMRERIAARLEALLLEQPENANLRRQEDLLSYAKIMTIDSFCLYVVRNYYSSLQLDPDFRIGEEGELKLIRKEVLAELLEKKYQEADPEFLLFADSYARGRKDDAAETYIENLYRFADAYPEPEKQLREWKAQLKEDMENEPEQSRWMKTFLDEMHLLGKELVRFYDAAIAMCQEADGPYYYEEMFRSDRKLAEAIRTAQSYEELAQVFDGIGNKFVRRPSKKDSAVSEDKKTLLADLRDELKGKIKGIADDYDMGSAGQAFADAAATAGPLCELCDLTLEFTEAYSAAKREKNVVDFPDVEHFAYQILTDPDSPAAAEMRRSFHEIMIDEYQDSNRIQEEILTSVSGLQNGIFNVFMVGDVKQSIYKFRQARPELFMEKYHTYSETESEKQKIDLHCNFRSRRQVLESVNYMFGQLMEAKLGGITYDAKAALVPGRSFPEAEEEEVYNTELCLLDVGKKKKEYASEAQQEMDNQQLETQLIAAKIKEITDPLTGLDLYDDKLGGYRKAQYGDIAVLLRTMTGWAETVSAGLLENGIPSYAQSRTGYFGTWEISTILNLLRILDNPMQDIPLTAVLMSPIAGFTSEELAIMTAEKKRVDREEDASRRSAQEAALQNEALSQEELQQAAVPGRIRGIYGALWAYACSEEAGESSEADSDISGTQTTLGKKVKNFLDMLEAFRQKAVYMPLHQLLNEILEETGFRYILAAMPGGKLRSANVEVLIQRAVDFENTSYQGVFQFVRYIENLQKYSVDYGEASLTAGQENVVLITSIHKSKGLEYPVVILAGCAKGFNRQDEKESIVMHPDLGIAADFVDSENRIRTKTLPAQVLRSRLHLEMLGEELRVLYVAMTRAQEKLIMTAAEPFLENKLKKHQTVTFVGDPYLPQYRTAGAGSFLDWILMTMIRSRSYREINDMLGLIPPTGHELYQAAVPVKIELEEIETLAAQEVERQSGSQDKRTQLLEWAAAPQISEEEFKKADTGFAWTYPYEAAANAPIKFSVSALKETAMETHEDPAVRLALEGTEQEEKDHRKPRFLEETEPSAGGAKTGTLYHRVLELLPMDTDPAKVMEVVAGLEEKKRVPAGTGQQVKIWKLGSFLRSPIAGRMAAAQARGQLHREQPFVLGVPAQDVRPEYAGTSVQDETVLIQGIIDVWFEEDGQLVLVDYKTDRVAQYGRAEGADVLRERYSVQMECYRKALEAAVGKTVKEIVLYSFSLEEGVSLLSGS